MSYSPVLAELVRLVDGTPLYEPVVDHVIEQGLIHDQCGDSPEPDWLAAVPNRELFDLACLMFVADGYPEICVQTVRLVGRELLERIVWERRKLTAAAFMNRLLPRASLERLASDGPREAVDALGSHASGWYPVAVWDVLEKYVDGCQYLQVEAHQ